jgi:N-sulfoglucosamine sulfohydrolase
MVRFPDSRMAGKVDDRFVSAVDYVPTTGVTIPAGATQGRNIFTDSPWTHVFAARDRMDISIDRMRAVRTKQFKYIRNFYPAIPYMQHNPYKEQEYPTWNLVKEWARSGKLNREQGLFASPVKPIEELYDVVADPDEVRNLALDPSRHETLQELRALVEGFIRENDSRLPPEDPLDIQRGYYGKMQEEKV